MNLTWIVASICAFLLSVSLVASAQEATDGSAQTVSLGISPRVDSLDLVVDTPAELFRIQVAVQIDGKSVASLWDDAFATILKWIDHDQDGVANEAEAEQLPSPFALRLGPPFLHAGEPPAFAGIDLNKDRRIDLPELADFYRRNGLGGPIVGVGRPPSTNKLTDALLGHLDRSGDGSVEPTEWQSAAEVLAAIDRNEDELISPTELVRQINYPGSTGTELLIPPVMDAAPRPVGERSPLVMLPIREADLEWAHVLLRDRDQNRNGHLEQDEAGLKAKVLKSLDKDADGALAAPEIAAWRKLSPDLHWPVNFDSQLSNSAPVSCVAGQVRLELRAAEGQLPKVLATHLDRYLARFAEADLDRDGLIAEQDVVVPGFAELRRALPIADRNSDNKLSKDELRAWLNLQEKIAQGHVTITVLDYGRGLFEFFDADHDGAISRRELRDASQRVAESGGLNDRQFDRSKLPRQLVVTASRGRSQSAYHPPRNGPPWFRAMDRNGDGDVSRREFNGSTARFNSLDLNKDGLIGPNEIMN